MKQVQIVFDQIKVTSIESSSGIFVGTTNRANGWSSQSKRNYGFGRAGDGNTIESRLNLVYDNDFIDSPMDDRQITIDNSKKEPGNNTSIHFNSINVQQLDENCTVSIGESAQNGWSTKDKNNYGNGDFYGKTILPNNRSIIYDNDIMDSPIKDNDYVRTQTGR